VHTNGAIYNIDGMPKAMYSIGYTHDDMIITTSSANFMELYDRMEQL